MKHSFITITDEQFRETTFNQLGFKIIALKQRLLKLKNTGAYDERAPLESISNRKVQILNTSNTLKDAMRLKLLFSYKNAVISLTLPDMDSLDRLLNEPDE